MGNSHLETIGYDHRCEICNEVEYLPRYPEIRKSNNDIARVCDTCVSGGCSRFGCGFQAAYLGSMRLFCQNHWNDGNPYINDMF
jgi:hypothetical protein